MDQTDVDQTDFSADRLEALRDRLFLAYREGIPMSHAELAELEALLEMVDALYSLSAP